MNHDFIVVVNAFGGWHSWYEQFVVDDTTFNNCKIFNCKNVQKQAQNFIPVRKNAPFPNFKVSFGSLQNRPTTLTESNLVQAVMIWQNVYFIKNKQGIIRNTTLNDQNKIPVGFVRAILESSVGLRDMYLFAKSYTCKNKKTKRLLSSRMTVQPCFRCYFRQVNSFPKHIPDDVGIRL
jgi:hypothetical protein